MTAKKSKRALWMSAISLFLCIVMLAGTTFAWFTDSVSSENNIIKAGNLDIELYWSRTADDKDWHKVGESTNIFKDDTLWEPGHTEVIYLKVVNEGSLALKYWLGVNIADEIDGVNQQGESFRLSDHIKFGVVKTGDTNFKSKYDTRAEALAAIDADDYKAISAGYSNSSVLYPKTNAEGFATQEYATLVVTMPEDVDDVANHNGVNIPKIFLGLNVFATQLTYEKDSYGSDYDIGAPWTGEKDISWYNTTDNAFVLTTPQQLAGLAELVNSKTDNFSKKTIVLGADIDLNNIEWTPIGTSSAISFNGTFDGDGHTVSNLLITGRKNAVGLFGWEKGTIQNLTVENAKVSGGIRVGVIAGQAHYGLSDITITGHVEVNGARYVAGVAGQGAYNTGWTNITIDVDDTSYVKAISTVYEPGNPDADENGNVIVTTCVGGVLGHMADPYRYFTNITTNIDVYGDGYYVGGVFGLAQYGAILTDITATGNVIGVNEVSCLGGIVGVRENSKQYIVFNNCEFTGTIYDGNGNDITNEGDNKLYGGLYRAETGTGILIVDSKDEDGNWAVWDTDSLVNGLAQGGTVKMYKALASMHSTVTTPLEVPASNTVTLDLNGLSAQGTWGFAAMEAMLVNNGTLTIKNGTLKNSGGNSCSTILNNGTLTLENVAVLGGNISRKNNNHPEYAIENFGTLTAEDGTSITAYGGGIKTMSGATTVINGGTVKVNASNWTWLKDVAVHTIYADANATVTINGGSFEKGNTACKSTLLGAADTAILTVKGGTFNADPSNINGVNYVAADHQVVDNGDNTYTVFAKIPGVEISKDPASGLIWNGNDANNQSVYYIYSAADLQKASTYFAGQAHSPEGDRPTFELMSDIDMAGIAWTPWDVQFIYFNGNNHTISNLTTNGDSSWNGVSGLFGYLGGCTVKDLTLKNVISTGSMAGTFAGQTEGSDLINCTLEGVNVVAWSKPTADATVGDGIGAFVGVTVESSSDYTCTIADGATVTLQYNGMLNSANVNANLNAYAGGLFNSCTPTLNITNNGKLVFAVATTAELISAVKSAPVGSVTEIELADGTYDGDIDITVAALGKSGGDVVIKAAEGAKPVITGTVTLGYRKQGTGNTMYDANVTFEGITFNHADSTLFSIEVGDVKSLDLINCTIIGAGETGIHAANGNDTGASKITGCTFINAAVQGYGNYCSGMVIEGCTFTNSCINIQGGNGVTVQNCTFNNTLTNAHIDGGFYAIRSNSTPITVKGCEISIDSELTTVVTGQAKWYLLANRGTTNWTVENVAVTMSDAALMQTELKVTACTSTGLINTTNLTVNGVVQ